MPNPLDSLMSQLSTEAPLVEESSMETTEENPELALAFQDFDNTDLSLMDRAEALKLIIDLVS